MDCLILRPRLSSSLAIQIKPSNPMAARVAKKPALAHSHVHAHRSRFEYHGLDRQFALIDAVHHLDDVFEPYLWGCFARFH